jgi:hypothetical protein
MIGRQVGAPSPAPRLRFSLSGCAAPVAPRRTLGRSPYAQVTTMARRDAGAVRETPNGAAPMRELIAAAAILQRGVCGMDGGGPPCNEQLEKTHQPPGSTRITHPITQQPCPAIRLVHRTGAVAAG